MNKDVLYNFSQRFELLKLVPENALLRWDSPPLGISFVRLEISMLFVGHCIGG